VTPGAGVVVVPVGLGVVIFSGSVEREPGILTKIS